MRLYSQIRNHSRKILDAAGHDDVNIYPGPELPDIATRYVVWTPYGGSGLEGGEHALDNRSWQFRAVGHSLNYDSTEEIADALDIALISHYSSKIEGLWVTQITRVGSAPTPLPVDDADRTHMVGSYVFEFKSALVNG